MFANVLSFLDSMRLRTCSLGHKRTLTDIGGLGRTLPHKIWIQHFRVIMIMAAPQHET